jgi:hypothetical protein
MANPPYGDSSLDPAMPTYAAGTIWNTLNDTNSDGATIAFTSTGSTTQMRAYGVKTSNADHTNGTHANVVPKAFPGLQS